jgi:signal transduction histidine kinase
MTDKGIILIVDDNPTNLGVLFDSLERDGFRVLVATNGEAALQAVGRVRPDIVLLDVQMPGIDGFETCRRLKADEATRDIPVIFMTALTEPTDEGTGLQLGAVDYITKPIKVEMVLARLNTHLTIRDLQRVLQEQNAELAVYDHTVTHDLDIPLTAVTDYTGVLEASGATMSGERLQECLRTVAQGSRRIYNIIAELQLLSIMRRVEDVEVGPVDMVSVVAKAQDRLLDSIEECGVEIILPESWPVAKGYGPWIEQVWVSYIDNAIKCGGNPPHVELGADVGPVGDSPHGMVRFWVRDDGPGLAVDERERLFVPLEQLAPAHARGHGVGLSIAQRIVQRLGGKVGVESKVGEGSTFWFTLPS